MGSPWQPWANVKNARDTDNVPFSSWQPSAYDHELHDFERPKPVSIGKHKPTSQGLFSIEAISRG